MKYQLLPPLTKEERDGLMADVKARGVLVPVEKDEDGEILDGHNRAAIADELGIDYPVITRRFASEQEKREHVLKINLVRRHLDPLRWGQVFAKLLTEKGVQTGQGARNDVTANGTDGSTSATVAEVAAEVGTPERTARQRVAVARKYDALPKKQKQAVDKGEKTVHKAHREQQRKKKQKKPKKQSAGLSDDRCRVIVGDAVEQLAKLPAGSVRLAFADPPYNVGIDYGDGADKDRLPGEQYVAWCRSWFDQIHRVLTGDGAFWLLCGYEYADLLAVELRKAGFHRRAWVTWYETFGVCNSAKNNFSRTSRPIFYCVKNPMAFVWNVEAVTRSSDRQAKYNDARADPEGKVWDDVWQIPRLTGTSKERLPDFPTQLPVALLLPIIGCASDPGDLVLDPFSGSGTTGSASLRLGRRYVGVERNENFARLAQERLEGERDGDESGKGTS